MRARYLAELLRGSAEPLPGLAVRGLAWDSRRVRPGDLFFAIPGEKHDGHDFIAQAVAGGAVAVVGERSPEGCPVPYIRVPDVREALGRAASAFWGHPTGKLTTVGVTGTDGKTTVVHLLGQLLPGCEALTTVRVEREGLSCVTTPEAPDIQRIAAAALARGKVFFALEASSIGLAQRRLVGTEFAVAVLTNISRDHLDFHGTMEAYVRAKMELFRMLRPGGMAVVNVADPHAEAFLAETRGDPLTYGIGDGDIRAKGVRELGWGYSFTLVTPGGAARARVPFPGRFNLENALAAAAVAWGLGLSPRDIAARLAGATLPAGRFVRLAAPNGALAVVDYAHTPRALEAVLAALRPRARRLIVVFGAPGEADRGKRRPMGKVVGAHADHAIVTSDNPKGEDPAAIAREIAAGLEEFRCPYEVELHRGAAIRRALGVAGPGDVVLVAGKGHERYQLLGTGPVPHSDIRHLLDLGCKRIR